MVIFVGKATISRKENGYFAGTYVKRKELNAG
jgi:hypothetical protein